MKEAKCTISISQDGEAKSSEESDITELAQDEKDPEEEKEKSVECGIWAVAISRKGK